MNFTLQCLITQLQFSMYSTYNHSKKISIFVERETYIQNECGFSFPTWPTSMKSSPKALLLFIIFTLKKPFSVTSTQTSNRTLNLLQNLYWHRNSHINVSITKPQGLGLIKCNRKFVLTTCFHIERFFFWFILMNAHVLLIYVTLWCDCDECLTGTN